MENTSSEQIGNKKLKPNLNKSVLILKLYERNFVQTWVAWHSMVSTIKYKTISLGPLALIFLASPGTTQSDSAEAGAPNKHLLLHKTGMEIVT